MNKKPKFLLLLALMLLVTLLLPTLAALAASVVPGAGITMPQQQVATPIPLPTQPPVDGPAERVLPPVGSNAGLLLGVSLLVLIIIGGVVWGRKH